MADVLVIARASDVEIARRLSSALAAQGATTQIDTRAIAQGRISPSLVTALRKADAVVLLLTSADATEQWWQDALVDAVRGVDAARLIPVLLGEHATRNMIWPIVADRSAISVPDPGNLEALLRFLQPMLALPQAPPGSSVPAPAAIVRETTTVHLDSYRGAQLADALNKQRVAIGQTMSTDRGGRRLLPVDDPVSLKSWGREARHNLAVLECIAGLGFAAVASSAGSRVVLQAHNGGSIANIADLARPTAADFTEQLGHVVRMASARSDRASEIISQTENRLPFWEQIAEISRERRPRTRELLEAATSIAVLIGARLKHAFAVPRPLEWSPNVMPMLAAPVDGSFPMGTAIESYFLGALLESIAGDRSSLKLPLRRVAHRICENRIVAGYNFPVDAVAGRAVGVALGRYALARGGLGKAKVVRLDADSLAGVAAFPEEEGDPPTLLGSDWAPAISPMLTYLLDSARQEW